MDKIYVLVHDKHGERPPILVIVENYQWEILEMLYDHDYLHLEKVEAFDMS